MATEDRPGPQIRIRERVTPAEVAAVTAAVGAGSAARPSRPTTPWLRAALREGLGGRPATQPSDLRDAGPASSPGDGPTP